MDKAQKKVGGRSRRGSPGQGVVPAAQGDAARRATPGRSAAGPASGCPPSGGSPSGGSTPQRSGPADVAGEASVTAVAKEIESQIAQVSAIHLGDNHVQLHLLHAADTHSV